MAISVVYCFFAVEATGFIVHICCYVDQASVYVRQSGPSCSVCCRRRAESRLSACSCVTDGTDADNLVC